MGTAKRERQKANRALKLEQQAKQERVQKVKRTGLQWLLYGGGLVLVIVALLWAGGAFSGGDDTSGDASSTATATDATSSVDTTPATTYAPLPKPEVSLPDPIPTELQVTELKPGEGPKAAVGDTVTLYYIGVTSADGVEFDSSYDPPRTFDVQIGATAVIQGWTEGLVGVQKGGQYQLDIPSEMAYGADGFPPKIGPDAALTFVVDILNVKTVGSASASTTG